MPRLKPIEELVEMKKLAENRIQLENQKRMEYEAAQEKKYRDLGLWHIYEEGMKLRNKSKKNI